MTERDDAARVWGLDDPPGGRFPPGWTTLGAFNEAGVLAPADVHVAARLARLGGDADPAVALAAALAVRAPRVGHVSVDLARVREVAASDLDDDVDLTALPWPEPAPWLAAVAASALVATGEPDGPVPDGPAPDGGGLGDGARPLRLIGTSLYLDRYWRDERAVAAELTARAGEPPDAVAGPGGADSGEALLPDDPDQRRAVLQARDRRLTVLVGGPGTGKTTTVARLLALLHHEALAAGRRPPLVALAAPTGKAAARLEEAVRAEAGRLPASPAVRDQLLTTPGLTLHRLLGARPGSSRFRHHRGHRLPHDTVVVDEASMVSLGLMARLLEAVRPDARLVLVGDPDQLVSVEAGAVLAGVAGPAAAPGSPASGAAGSSGAIGSSGAAGPLDGGMPPVAGAVALLRTNHRSAGPLAALAAAVRAGDADEVVALLATGDEALTWLPAEPTTAGEAALGPLRRATLAWAEPMVRRARSGDAPAACAALAAGRVLCAHRRGPAGAAAWNDRLEGWVLDAAPEAAAEGPWYAGRPVLMTANDYSLRVFNGDAGVVVAVGSPGEGTRRERVVAFDGRGEGVRPGRLAAVETVYAMTVHKSQGSEFDSVALVLPPPSSRLLTRELLYTAVTRARRHLLVVGEEEALRSAVERRIARASGLGARLWAPVAGKAAAGT